MKKVDFNKLQAGDLVEVPRTQFAPMRSGWNGWLFSEAVVIRKGVGRKSKKNVVVVEMRTPAGKNSYGTIEATFYAENVFTTPAAKNARNILKKYGIEDAESFYKFIEPSSTCPARRIMRIPVIHVIPPLTGKIAYLGIQIFSIECPASNVNPALKPVT